LTATNKAANRLPNVLSSWRTASELMSDLVEIAGEAHPGGVKEAA
jgi:hypothetical protein